MPVTATVTQTITYVLVKFSVDMVAMTAAAQFQQSINGTPAQVFEVDIGAADLQTLLGAAPTGATRGADVTDAIYQFAVTKGYMTGTVS